MTTPKHADNLYRIFPGKLRVDGKIPTQFVYPISGRRITKLLTADQLDHAIAERRAKAEQEAAQ